MITDQWRKFGRAVAQNAEDLEQIYHNPDGELDLQRITQGWHFLAEHGFILGNSELGYSASSLLLQLSDCLALTESRQLQAPDVEEWLANLKRLVKRYDLAKKENDYNDVLTTKREVRTHVLIMQNTLELELRQLEYFIDNKFGHVNSLKAKQQENEYCIERASRFSKKLTMINEAEISRLCGEDFELMQIFLRKLLPFVKQSRERLLAVIPRLKNILWEYRRIDHKTHLVQLMHNYLQSNSPVSEDTLSNQVLIASPANHVAQLPIKSYADMVTKMGCRENLIHIVKSMSARDGDILIEEAIEQQASYLVEKKSKKTAELAEPILQSKLNQFIQAFKQKPQSARQFWLSQSEPIVPVGVWIWWVHQSLRQSKDPLLQLTPHFEALPAYSANQVVSDLTVSYPVKL